MRYLLQKMWQVSLCLQQRYIHPFKNFVIVQPKEVINRQIKNNTQLNLLYSGQELSFSFSCELKKLIKKIIAGELTASEVNELIVYASKAALSSFYQVNQYYQFDARATK